MVIVAECFIEAADLPGGWGTVSRWQEGLNCCLDPDWMAWLGLLDQDPCAMATTK